MQKVVGDASEECRSGTDPEIILRTTIDLSVCLSSSWERAYIMQRLQTDDSPLTFEKGLGCTRSTLNGFQAILLTFLS